MIIKLDTVLERDIDLLLLNLLVNDKEFIHLFLENENVKHKIKNNESIDVVDMCHSLKENDGESDIFFKAIIDGKEYGFYVENKIDAPAMVEQYARYQKRAKMRFKNDNYFIFITCSKKYYEANEEAKKYLHLEYERIISYLESKEACNKNIYAIELFREAVKKSKAKGETRINLAQREFLKNYIDYQNKYYPDCTVITNPEKSNGGWVEFECISKSKSLRHKQQEGEVALDLYFKNNERQSIVFNEIFNYLRDHGYKNIVHVNKPTTKCCSIVISVPKIDNNLKFENIDKNELSKCFEALKELKEIEGFLSIVQTEIK